MATAIWVALGGAAGSLARHGVTGMVNSSAHPWGTVLVNILGSFALGVIIGIWGFEASESHRIGLTVGLLGGFTTFSAFSADVLRLWESGRAGMALLSVLVSVVAGIGAAAAGVVISRALAG